LRAYRGLPKNKALIKYLSEEGIRSLLQKTEALFMQEQSKNMHIIDDELYFMIDEKHNQVDLSEKGIELISTDTDPDFFVLPDIGSEIAQLEKAEMDQDEKAKQKTEMMTNFGVKSERVHTMNQLLKAYALFEKDTEYVLMENKVKIVDEQTGRIMEGRRFSDGLHQAIEAKENVKIEASTQTYATVTLQNYFRMYNKLSGMTGTAETEAGEFWEIYKLDVVVIPTNRPIARDDRQDQVYKTKREKYNAVIAEVVRLREEGRSILVGTTSVEISELLSRALKIQKVPHQVLNAKLHQKEADVVAEAGRAGTVTIATNMAGRGTDIKLSDEVKGAGGLAIIGTERHDSRRVDRQLRGRAGRQGDVGSSQFYVSLEDNLMRLFGSEKIAGIMDRMGLEEGEMIQHSMVSKSIERAQKKVEENNFGTRKRLLEYDDVMNSQREVIYKRRRHALFGERLSLDISNMIYDTCGSIVAEFQPSKDYEGFKLELYRVLALDAEISESDFNSKSEEDTTDFVYNKAIEAYQLKSERIAKVAFPVIKNVFKNKNNNFQNIVVPFTDGAKAMQVATNLEEAYESEGKTLTKDFEKGIVLAIIDDSWKEHLREMDELRQNVQGAAYEQKDPLLIYKFEAFQLFQRMLDATNKEIVSFLMKGDLPHPDPSQMRQAPVQQKTDMSQLQTSHAEAQEIAQGGGGEPGQPQQAQRPPRPKQVIKTEKQYGRNERVKIQNLVSGEEKELKFKQAEPLLSSNQWTIVE
jgi:preprotein translocase subunit SecA